MSELAERRKYTAEDWVRLIAFINQRKQPTEVCTSCLEDISARMLARHQAGQKCRRDTAKLEKRMADLPPISPEKVSALLLKLGRIRLVQCLETIQSAKGNFNG